MLHPKELIGYQLTGAREVIALSGTWYILVFELPSTGDVKELRYFVSSA